MIDQRAARNVLPNPRLPADLDTAGDGGHRQDDARIALAAVPTHSPDTEAGQTEYDVHGPVASLSDREPARNGQKASVLQSNAADLAQLHQLIGHYARQLWDVQAARIAAGNRVAAMHRDGLAAMAKPAEAIVAEYEAIERGIDRVLTKEAKRHFMAPWVLEQRGIGLPGFARLLGVTGSLGRFATVSKLWKYLGLHVVDGHAPRREKGVPWTHTNCQGGHLLTCKPDCTTDHHPNCTPDGIGTAYAPQGRVVCHQIGDSIVKLGHRKSCHQPACAAPTTCSCLSECTIDHGGPYRRAYMAKKAYYEAEREDWTQARRHNAAMRYAVKELIKEMWVEWRVRRPNLE